MTTPTTSKEKETLWKFTPKDIARFWVKVNKRTDDECWMWLGATSKVNGYGQFGFKGRSYCAHRMSYRINRGNFDPELKVCHSCDVKGCVNPNHLWLGTQTDNMRDCKKKGRLYYQRPESRKRGEEHGSSKLTDAHIRAIRYMYATGYFTHEEISDHFRISETEIRNIVDNKVWRHVQDDITQLRSENTRLREALRMSSNVILLAKTHWLTVKDEQEYYTVADAALEVIAKALTPPTEIKG